MPKTFRRIIFATRSRTPRAAPAPGGAADDKVAAASPRLGQERVRRAARGALRRVRAATHEAQVEQRRGRRRSRVRGGTCVEIGRRHAIQCLDFHTGYNNAASYKAAAPAASNAQPRQTADRQAPPNASHVRVEGGRVRPRQQLRRRDGALVEVDEQHELPRVWPVASASACQGWAAAPAPSRQPARRSPARRRERGAARRKYGQFPDDVAHDRRQVDATAWRCSGSGSSRSARSRPRAAA